MSFYNKDILRKKEEMKEMPKCNYKLCFQNNCNDMDCQEHSCLNFGVIKTEYGYYCKNHWKEIKGYLKK